MAAPLALLGAVVTTVANFGLALLVARAGAETAGVFFAATAVITIAGNTCSLGTMTAFVWSLPEATQGSNPNLRRLVLSTALAVTLVGAGAGLALTAMADPAGRAIAGSSGDDVATMLRLLAVVVPFWALTVSLLGATRGLGSMTPTVVVNQVLRPLGQVGAVTVVVLAGWTSAQSLALAWGVPVVLAAGATVAATAQLGGFAAGADAAPSMRAFWRYARPRAVSSAAQVALERLDVVIVSALAGPALAGIYGSISRFVTAGNFAVFAIGQATSGPLRRALVDDDRAGAQRLLQNTTAFMVLITWPYFLVLALHGSTVATVFDPSYAVGGSALAIMAVAMLANSFAGPADLALLMLGRSGMSLLVTVGALATDLVLAWLLVPRWGLVGAAIAWGAAVIIQNGAAALLVHRIGDLRAQSTTATVLGAAAVAAVVPVGLLAADSWRGVAVTIAVGALLLGPVAAGAAVRLGFFGALLPAPLSRLARTG
ncbi:MAG: oligosaccharide flippase family protein [Actinomycetota bacterium]